MQLTSVYPVLMSEEPCAVARFYQDYFGFETTFESDWYVSLRRDTWELAILDPAHESIPAAYRGRAASGVVLNLEVEDVDEAYRRVVERGGLTAVVPLRSEAFGQRHFIVEAPGSVLVDVITPIPPSESHAAQYA